MFISIGTDYLIFSSAIRIEWTMCYTDWPEWLNVKHAVMKQLFIFC